MQVSLGDDDPVTFASCLPDEFCHICFALIRRGVGASDALEWLNQVRHNGMRARFTLSCSKRPRRERGKGGPRLGDMGLPVSALNPRW